MLDTIFWFPRWLVAKPWCWFAFWIVFLPMLFAVDRQFGLLGQSLLSLFAWWMFFGALMTQNYERRVLLVVLVIVATIFEVIASIGLGWYTYRLHNIPAWVPAGHGIIFFTALMGSELTWARANSLAQRSIVTACAAVYCGLMLVFRSDFAGAVYGMVFLVWLWALGERKGRFYGALWFWVFYLELSGVLLGAWRWGDTMPITGWSEANPPSGIVGAYGVFDLLSFVVAALIIRSFSRRD